MRGLLDEQDHMVLVHGGSADQTQVSDLARSDVQQVRDTVNGVPVAIQVGGSLT